MKRARAQDALRDALARSGRAQPPALVLGAGLTALGVTRALGRAGIPRYLPQANPAAVRRSRWYGAPPGGRLIERYGEFADYLQALPLDGAVLVPAADDAAVAIAQLPVELNARFPSSLPSAPVLSALVDKGGLLALLDEHRVPHPRTIPVDRSFDPADLGDLPIERAFIKPRDSQQFVRRFRVKGLHVDSRDALREHLSLLAREGIPVLVQEYVPGPPTNHYFVEGFIDAAGRIRARMSRKRLRMHPPDFGNSSAMVTVPLEEVAPASADLERLLHALRYRGVYSAEFKRDERDGVFRLLEINARPWWYVEFAARCGVDVVMMSYLDALGIEVPEVTAFDVGRELIYPLYDVRACLRADGSTLSGRVRKLVASWVRADWAACAWDDPWPPLADVTGFLRRSVSRRLTSDEEAARRQVTPRHHEASEA
jgi:predicted ATP-grasp superfamily ATP-dependent carboligase